MTEEIRECYRILELEPEAALSAVREAYRDLIKIWHPDRFPNDAKFQKRATEKTRELNDAYQKISAYLSGTYTESRASARAAAEAAEREEAAEAEARAHADRFAGPPPVPPVIPGGQAPGNGTPRPRPARLKKLIKGAVVMAVLAPLWSWWNFGDPRYLLWSEDQCTIFNAGRGHGWAQSKLGWMYDSGQGVPQNHAEALRWYSKAAEQGDAMAQNNLGVMYHNGQSVQRDDVEAYKWYCLAAAQGNGNGVTNRNSLAPYLTPGQLAEGQRRAAAAQFEFDFYKKYPDLRPYGAIVDAVATRLQASGYHAETREAVMETFAREAREEIKRQRDAQSANTR